MKSLFASFALAATALLSVNAIAQDASLPASFGTTTLDAGFVPDPVTASVVAGGNIQVSIPGCTGWIASAPDYEFTYSGGGGMLSIYFKADGDTTLLVNGPDGQWHCADDTNGFNPAVEFHSPEAGTYDIWVGTYTEAAGTSGTLNISELAPQW